MDKFEIREGYVSGNILQVGQLVEDIETGNVFQILDRGANYITVSDSNGNILKKWITDVKQKNESVSEPFISNEQVVYNHVSSQNLNQEISEVFVESFDDTDDKFAWSHALINTDAFLVETDLNRKYELLLRVENFFDNMGIETPLFVIVEKSEVEKSKLVSMIAAVANIEPAGDSSTTIQNSIKAMKDSKLNRSQWEVVHPLFKAAKSAGVSFSLSSVPYLHEDITDPLEKVFELIDDNIDEFVGSLSDEELQKLYDESDSINEELFETLTIQGRNKLSRDMRRRESQLQVKRERALNKGASVQVLQSRARKLAITMLKRRLFKKAPADLNRAEKERFEKGASKRKQLIDRLAKRLLNRVRTIQRDRLAHK